MSRKNQSTKRTAAVLLQALKQESSDEVASNSAQKECNDSATQTDPPESNSTDVKLNKVLVLLAHANAKLDAIGSAGVSGCKHENDAVALRKISLEPVKNIQELEDLEEKCKSDQFVSANVASIGQMHGRQRYTSRGGTVCLQIIDYFFDRQFLVQCSWTGTGRKLTENEEVPRKIPFARYEKVINLFYQTVLHSDPEFSLDECKKFLHRCLRNAKQRLEEVGGARKPVARKRQKLRELNGQDAELEAEYVNDTDDEGEISGKVWSMEFAVGE